ncbi:hypothetical protein ACFWG0_36465 [Streptomyces yangpuensis]|uniref:hypothetical protein n=1 Tax=Streptomyces yangpuensis TaxID=1648182 RepID=UPI00365E7DD4
MNVIAELTLRDLGATVPGQLSRYSRALEVACSTAPPPYGTRRYGEIYRSAASDPAWIVESLITSAEREADGAGRLWSLAACTEDRGIADLVKQHAIDEARHARWYIAVLDLVFPGAVDPAVRTHLDAVPPEYHHGMETRSVPDSPFAHPVTIDDLVQMNIAEIRTAVNQRLQRPVLLAYCDPSRRDKLTALLDRLLHDEVRHVGYSAELIERLSATDPAALVELMLSRMRDFNEITCAEVEGLVFPLHCSREECRSSAVCINTGRTDTPAQGR